MLRQCSKHSSSIACGVLDAMLGRWEGIVHSADGIVHSAQSNVRVHEHSQTERHCLSAFLDVHSVTNGGLQEL